MRNEVATTRLNVVDHQSGQHATGPPAAPPENTAGIAYVCYAVIGVFAAARYGLRTEGDILVNRWLPGRWDGVLSAATTLCEPAAWLGCSVSS